jgi:xanthine permease
MSSPSGARTPTPDLVYGVDDRPPLVESVGLGIQHLVVMLLGNITPPLLIAGALGLGAADTATLLQAVLLWAGLATVIQSYPLGPIGGRIPVVMGTSIAFVGVTISIGNEAGLSVVFGACLVAALMEIGLGFSIGRLKRLFPPLVNGIVVMLIGLTLIPVGVDYAAGGAGSADYGAPRNLALAAVVFVGTLALNQYAKGWLKHGSMLIAVAVGYVAAVGVGVVDFSGIGDAPWASLPSIAPFGLQFELSAILLLAFVYVVSAMETLGDISGIMAAAGRDATTTELKGGLVADGVMSGLAALFSAFPNTSYSQNVGLVNFTGVVSRHVTAITGVLLVLLGLVPKAAAAFATIPAPVIGGGGLIMFAMIFASGLAIIQRGVEPNQRNLVILAVSMALGLGVELRPAALMQLPDSFQTLFGSGLLTGGMTALLLNLVLPASPGRTPPSPGGAQDC